MAIETTIEGIEPLVEVHGVPTIYYDDFANLHLIDGTARLWLVRRRLMCGSYVREQVADLIRPAAGIIGVALRIEEALRKAQLESSGTTIQ